MTGSENKENSSFYIHNITPKEEIPSERSRSKKGPIVLLGVTLVLLAGLVAYFFIFKNLGRPDPDTMVKEALTAFIHRDTPLKAMEEYLGEIPVTDSVMNGQYSEDISLSVQKIDGNMLPNEAYMLKSAGIDAHILMDIPSEKARIESSITYGGIDYITAGADLSGEELSVYIPAFFDGSLFLETTSFGDDFNASIFRQFAPQDLPADLSFPVWDTYDQYFATILPSLYSIREGDYLSSLTFSEGEKEDLTIAGDTVSCRAYPAVIDKSLYEDKLSTLEEAIIPLLSRYGITISSEEWREQLEKLPVELVCYLDKKDTLRRITIKSCITAMDQELDLNLTLDLEGETKPDERITGKIGIGIAGVESTLRFTIETECEDSLYQMHTQLKVSGGIAALDNTIIFDSSDGTFYVTAKLDKEKENYADFLLSGTLSADSQEKTITADVDAISLSLLDLVHVTLSGQLDYTAKTPSIPALPSPKREFLKMEEEEFSDFVLTTYDNIEKSPLFSLLF